MLSTLIFVEGGKAEPRLRALAAPLDSARESLRKAVSDAYAARCAQFGVKRPKTIALTDAERAAVDQGVVLVRTEDFVCPLESDFLVEKLGPSVLDAIGLRGDEAYEALNFVDGQRSPQDILWALRAEYGPIDPAKVEAFFKVLEKAGLIRREKK